ncbi:efflux RND transporter periplasmic adaptor subunit [Bacillus coahuilensis]|uniref:efflux RND transporter periplasmic adaptor subunit n=1 Tax=Bacillus coahuilensis TaxID=408580 RepID=UPI0001850888|nr:efflux RND transporter periplasmic adaptor subunit [Bacillus coahuilensis]
MSKKKLWIGIGVVTLIAALIGFNVYKTQAKNGPMDVSIVSLENKEISSDVMIPGTLKIQEEKKYYLDPTKGKIDGIKVEEGQNVKSGDTLYTYKSNQLELEMEQNKLAMESDYLQINRVQDQLDDLPSKEKELTEQIGKEEAKKQIAAERDQLNMELRLANIGLKQNMLQRDALTEQEEELVVTAEIDGTILSLDETVTDGITSEMQTPFIHIVNLNSMIVTGSISEYDSIKLESGQPVSLRSEVVTDKTWTGSVSEVGLLPVDQGMSEGFTTNGVVQYPITVKVEEDITEIKPGFQLFMDIETDRKTVDVLPVEVVQEDEEGYFVLVVEDGNAVKKE